MLEDTFETMEEDELEEEAQHEVDKVLWEITAGTVEDISIPSMVITKGVLKDSAYNKNE